MDAKDSRTESSLGEHSDDGRTKYAHNSNAINCDRNKPYQDNGSNSLVKVDVPIARPCAVIGPDRIVPPSISNDGYMKKSDADQWSSLDSYCRPPDYPHKLPDCQNQTRNISPRQTFQENMQRIMVPPRYNAVKLNDEMNFPVDRNIVQSKFHKFSVPPEGKYGEVPYIVNPVTNEPKSVRNPDMYVTNPPVLRNSGWTTSSANVRPSRPYITPESYQYPDYGNCAGPKSVPANRTHRTIHDESGHVYADPYYHSGNIHFKPYPVKERYSQTRYDYIGNYSNPYHQPLPFPSQKYELQKSLPHHPYPAHPQVPLKYLENRLTEPIIESYQRTSNPQQNYNVQLRNPVIHPQFGPVPGNSLHNKAYPYPPDASAKSIPSNKLPYDHNKMYMEYDNMRNKQYQMSESFYSNEISRPFPIKGAMPPSYPPISVHSLSSHPYYRKDMKNYDYLPHLKNMDPTISNTLSRIPSQFSPSGVPISPESNTSNDATHTHGNLQDDCGYVSQSSTTSIRSVDSTISRVPNDFYRRYDFRYGPFVRNSPVYSKPDINTHSKEKKDIDVRQFLQMWNEGDDEVPENNINKEKVGHTHSNTIKQSDVNSHEQLYVLGLVNVPREELGKYEHIQKVSKLPENIKGYNNIELLNQFEEAIESSNIVSFNMKTMKSREVYSTLKTPMSAQQNEITRPLSPLDVEAKISQSVIHKEVGCNFEIKPCSPKMLNVEVAAPAKNIMTERIIEKVANPLTVRAPMILSSVDDSKNNANTVQLQDPRVLFNENLKIPSCKMINTQFLSTEATDQVKTNYCLQDLESNSGVCLASLPRLDNDIELNFPEVNQQFINANKIDSEIAIMYPKEIPTLNIEPNNMVGKEKLSTQDSSETPLLSSNGESEKEFVKLSKFRKNKANVLECKPTSPKVCSQIVRTDSVIIKNPENKKMEENHQLLENKVIHETQQNPINLTMQIDDTLKYIDDEVRNSSAAIDFSVNTNFNENKELMTKVIHETLFNNEVFVQSEIKEDFPVLLNEGQLKLKEAVVNDLPKIYDNVRIPQSGDPDYNNDNGMVEQSEIYTTNSICSDGNDSSQEKNEEKDCVVIANMVIEEKCREVNTLSNILSCGVKNVNDSEIEPKAITLQCNDFETSEKKDSDCGSSSAITDTDIEKNNENQEKNILMTNTGANNNYLAVSLHDNKKNDSCNQEHKETIDSSHETGNSQNKKLHKITYDNKVSLHFNTLNDIHLDQRLNAGKGNHDAVLREPSLKYKKNHNMVIDDPEELQSKQYFTNNQVISDESHIADIAFSADTHASQTKTCSNLKLQECSRNTKKNPDPILLVKVNTDQGTNSVVGERHTHLEFNECSTTNSISDPVLPEANTDQGTNSVVEERHTHLEFNECSTTNSIPDPVLSEVNIDQGTNFIKRETHTNIELQESSTKTQTISNLVEFDIRTVNGNIGHSLKKSQSLSYTVRETEEVSVKTNATCQDMTIAENYETHKSQECLTNSQAVAKLVPTINVTAALDNGNCTESIETELLNHKSQDFCIKTQSTTAIETIATPNDSCLMQENLNYTTNKQEMSQENTINENQIIENLSEVPKIFVKDNTESSGTCVQDNIFYKSYQSSSETASCQPLTNTSKENVETGISNFELAPFYMNKELFSPIIQNLIVQTEGPCTIYCNKKVFYSGIMDKTALRNVTHQAKKCLSVSDSINEHESVSETNTENEIHVENINCIESETNIGSTIDFEHEDHRESSSFTNNLKSKLMCKTVAGDNLPSIDKKSVKTLKEIAMEVLFTKSFIPETHDFERTYAFHDKTENSDYDKISVQSSDTKAFEVNKGNCLINVKLNESNTEKECHSPYTHRSHNLIRKKSLKRSFSDTEINLYNGEYYDDPKHISPEGIWLNKRKKKFENLTHPRLFHENICNIIQSNRRNSVSAVYNEENISFCILIDDNCIITEENDETQKICFTEILEDTVDKIEPINDNADENTIKIVSCLDDVGCEYPSPMILDCPDDKQLEETWVEDVACETIVSDDIAEDVIISMPTSPKSDLSDDSNNDKQAVFNTNINEHTEKVKYIYGDKMRTNDAQLVERLFRTPQMDVNKTLVDIESHIMEGEKYYDKESLVQILSGSNCHETSELDLYPTNNHTYFENCAIKSDMDGSDNLDISDPKGTQNNTFLLQNDYCESQRKSQVQKVRINVENSHNQSNNEFENLHKESPKYSSSSPEVSSTTPEEKNLSIKYAMTNYMQSNHTQINDMDAINKNNVGCRFKQEINYIHNNNAPTVRPLITKGAQKYIPPIKETIPDLKIKLPLPKNSLKKLKQLKVSKHEPKSSIKLTLNKNGSTLSKNEVYKTKKPKFEDVLKSIDEIQIKMHKEKYKKHRKSIPKVVIKKNENGSHYASTSKHDTYNPDLTGRKWQPWVFLEKDNFLDKMVLKKKTTAIYSHKKKAYVLAENIPKYLSSSNAKFVISQPKSEKCNGQLKCTIRLKHSQ